MPDKYGYEIHHRNVIHPWFDDVTNEITSMLWLSPMKILACILCIVLINIDQSTFFEYGPHSSYSDTNNAHANANNNNDTRFQEQRRPQSCYERKIVSFDHSHHSKNYRAILDQLNDDSTHNLFIDINMNAVNIDINNIDIDIDIDIDMDLHDEQQQQQRYSEDCGPYFQHQNNIPPHAFERHLFDKYFSGRNLFYTHLMIGVMIGYIIKCRTPLLLSLCSIMFRSAGSLRPKLVPLFIDNAGLYSGHFFGSSFKLLKDRSYFQRQHLLMTTDDADHSDDSDSDDDGSESSSGSLSLSPRGSRSSDGSIIDKRDRHYRRTQRRFQRILRRYDMVELMD